MTLTPIERGVALVAGILTIVNVIASFSLGSTTPTDDVSSFPSWQGSLPLRFLILLLLEFAIAYAFAAFTFHVIRPNLNLVFGIMLINFLYLGSAWITIFNLQWLLIGPWQLTGGYLEKFLLGLLGLGVLSSAVHVGLCYDENEPFHEALMEFGFWFHLAPFAVMGWIVAQSQLPTI